MRIEVTLDPELGVEDSVAARGYVEVVENLLSEFWGTPAAERYRVAKMTELALFGTIKWSTSEIDALVSEWRASRE